MTWFDAVVLSVIGLSTLFAAIRGGLREGATLIALGAGAALGFVCLKPILSLTGSEGSFFTTVVLGAILVTIFFIGLYAAFHFILKRYALSGQARVIDKTAGGVFGAFRGLILIGLAYLGYGYYLDEANQPDSVRNAFTQPIAAATAGFFESFAPDSTYIRTQESESEESEESSTENAAAAGYARGDRAGLSEMITTVTTSDPQDSQPKSNPESEVEGDPLSGLLVEEEQP